MGARWQYQTLTLSVAEVSKGLAWLDDYGKVGWELVSVIDLGNQSWVFILKAEVEL